MKGGFKVVDVIETAFGVWEIGDVLSRKDTDNNLSILRVAEIRWNSKTRECILAFNVLFLRVLQEREDDQTRYLLNVELEAFVKKTLNCKVFMYMSVDDWVDFLHGYQHPLLIEEIHALCQGSCCAKA